MNALPQKLKKDSLNEAVFEIRFESRQSKEFPELVVTKLSEYPHWKGYSVVRSPISEIPFQVRLQDANLLRQPTLELHAPNGQLQIKIGTHSISVHRVAPYPGWDAFRPELIELIEYIFSLFENFRITRLGLRYINAFTIEHAVNSVADLSYELAIAGVPFSGPQNINYMKVRSQAHTAVIRIASPELLVKQSPGVTALVDVDIFTSDHETIASIKETVDWLVDAHDYEKEEYFNLFTDEMKKHLVER